MNVLLVSQCDKRALTETRRILDQFAERRGDRTWQTAITQAGLDTLRKLLRKTARKNTAVACHWIRGLDHNELIWIVGDASRFNADGAVPTNTTKRDILRAGDENDWHTAQDIRLLATLAALLHDLGKASVAFQERLEGKRTEKNLYRHEWVSLRLFLAFVGGDDDEAWLTRMTGDATVDMGVWTAADRYLRDGVDRDINRHPFHELTSRAPLAAAIGWLIVTHHRLPVIPVTDEEIGRQARLGKRADRFEQAWLETPLDNVAHDWNEVDSQASSGQAKPYWDLAGPLPAIAPTWRAQAARAAKALLTLRQQRNSNWLGNPYVMHLARLTLMLADHHYSSLGVGPDNRAVAERRRFVQTGQTVFANTLCAGVMKQSLLEHLLGVGHTASLVAHALPNFERHLPRLVKHRGLRKRSADSRFAWQDKAFDAAVGLREAAREHGAFIVDMASTGCGKTLANARILYALADPQLGLRASYALGLRTLTLQTGRSYRHDLHLQDDELAVLVGGSASRALFAYYQARAEASGSASSQALIEEHSHVLYEGNVADHPLLSRALANPDIRRLLSAPMLVCTIDHLAPATESLRAGRQIAPMLRLMSSDLVLDELDDYGLDDLPALTRLMHWAGLLGTRVVLSSATLAPALVEGMFLAYHAGRTHYQRNRGRVDERRGVPIEVPCLWADEFGTQTQTCANADGFATTHRQFVARRVAKLQAAAPLRRAELVPMTCNATDRERIRAEFAHAVHNACLRLHHDHATTDPATGKRTSFGLVRMANIDPIFDVAQALYTLGSPADTRIHLCVYHARFPLLQRSAIEAMLDATFNRRDEAAIWQQPQVRHALDTCPEPDQLFVVLASPVCEVGRDWDADWAVVEPSSMRSLIQLAGRVQRHRRISGVAPNMLLFDTNLSGLKQRGTHDPVFTRPGFEKSTLDGRFLLSSHSLQALLAEHEYRQVDAVPRIQPRPIDELRPRERWVDLEQARIRASMLPVVPAPSQSSSRRRANPTSRLERDQAAPVWQFPQAALTGVLPQQQPFREQTLHETTLAWLPNEDEDKLEPHRVEDDPAQRGRKLYVPAPEMFHCIALQPTNRIDRWGQFDLLTLLTEQAEDQGRELANIARVYSVMQAPRSSQGWRWHPWLGVTRQP